MPFSVKVKGKSKDGAHALLDIEPPWWDAVQLREDARFIETCNTPGYLDYEADVSLEEMREVHERYRHAATTDVYEYDKWQEIIRPMMLELDKALYSQFDEYLNFHITIFEWESGLD
jgi:hypothetical protein